MAKIDIVELINNAPVDKLLEVGKRIRSTDYAVTKFNNKNHTKFYKNEEALRHAIRREAAMNAFGHADIIREMLTEESL